MKLEIQRRNLMTAGMWVVDTFYFPLPTAPPIFLALKENPEQLIIIQEGRIKPPEREEYLVPLTDCSQAQNILENVSCEIRNILIEVFVPKKKSLEMLENQMNILSNKFPFNVFLTIENFFGEIVNSLKDTAKVKMFNKEVILSADFYNSIPVISTLYQGMKLLFNLFIVFMFIKVLKWEVEVLIHSIT
jgi:small basic protein